MKKVIHRTDILFIWPPSWSWHDISITTPHLTAYARSLGLRAHQYDASIGFAHYIFNKDALDAHRPRSRDNLFTHALWKFIKDHSPLVWDSHGKTSDLHRQTILNAATSYYLVRFHTLSNETDFSLLGHSLESSISTMKAVNILAAQKKHPLTRYYRKHVVPFIEKFKPRILGISVSNVGQILAALLLAKIIKKSGLRIHITLGGDWPTKFASQIAEKRRFFGGWVDSYVIGDGEPALEGFADWLNGSLPLEQIDNLFLPNRGLKKNDLVYTDVNNLPIPIFEKKTLARYFQPIQIPLEMSRGCYWGKCAFCPQIEGVNSHYRPVDVDRLVQQIKLLKKHLGKNRFRFSSLAASPKQLRELSSQLIKKRLNIIWEAWLRLDAALSNDLLDLMARSGCEHMSPAPESLNQKTLDLLKKGYDASHVLRIIKHIKELGYDFHINIIVAFPGETEEDFFVTLEKCRKYGLKPVFFPFGLARHTPIFQNPEEYGVRIVEPQLKKKDMIDTYQYEPLPKTPQYQWDKLLNKVREKYDKYYLRWHGPTYSQDELSFDDSAIKRAEDTLEELVFPIKYQKAGKTRYAALMPNNDPNDEWPVCVYSISRDSYREISQEERLKRNRC